MRSIAVSVRGFTPLASIVPGIIFNTNNGSSDAITNIFANGLRSSANNLTLDGVAIVDTGNNGTLLRDERQHLAEQSGQHLDEPHQQAAAGSCWH